MLMQLGAVTFEVTPFNTDEIDHKAKADFAAHPVVGRMPPLEFVGEGEETWEFHGKLFPKKLGGLTQMEMMQGMRRSGTSQFLMRGDGVPMGWVVVEEVEQKSTYLAADGVGRVIEFNIKVKRAGGASPEGVFISLLSLFS